jgi:hypothetical protein
MVEMAPIGELAPFSVSSMVEMAPIGELAPKLRWPQNLVGPTDFENKLR